MEQGKAGLRNMLINGGKTVGSSSSLRLGAGLFICTDAVWETGFCFFLFFFFFFILGRKKTLLNTLYLLMFVFLFVNGHKNTDLLQTC